MVAGPIAIAYNVKGVSNLVLNADVAAKIFNGVVTTWNDPAIAALNSGATLPATPIKVFFRSDESGTTENFTNYLKAAAPTAWTAAPGKKWTGKGEGKEKSAGVSSAVASTDGGITYTEWSYATQNKLAMAKIDTGSGTPVELTGETAGKTVAGAKQVGTGNDLSLKLDYATKAAGHLPDRPGHLQHRLQQVRRLRRRARRSRASSSSFASDATQSGLEELGYAPLPKEVQTKVVTAVERGQLTPGLTDRGPRNVSSITGASVASQFPGDGPSGRPNLDGDNASTGRLGDRLFAGAATRCGPPGHRARHPDRRLPSRRRRPGAAEGPGELPHLAGVGAGRRHAAVRHRRAALDDGGVLGDRDGHRGAVRRRRRPLHHPVRAELAQAAGRRASSTCWPPCRPSSTASGA